MCNSAVSLLPNAPTVHIPVEPDIPLSSDHVGNIFYSMFTSFLDSSYTTFYTVICMVSSGYSYTTIMFPIFTMA